MIDPVVRTATTIYTGPTVEPGTEPLRESAEEFEAMFLNYLFKVMRSTVETSDSGGLGAGKDIYQEMFDNEIALNISKTRGLGLADLMYEQLKDLEGAGSGNKSLISKGLGAAVPAAENLKISAKALQEYHDNQGGTTGDSNDGN